jgi:hypothetical protein
MSEMSTPTTPNDPPVDPTLAFGEPEDRRRDEPADHPQDEPRAEPDQEPRAELPGAPRTMAFGEPAPAMAEPVAPYPPAGAEPVAPYRPTATLDSARREIRMRTVVLGLVLLVIAGSVLVHQFTDVDVDGGSVLLALMIGGGLLLIAGARRS